MTVEEIRAKLPECDVYSLKPDCTHIIVASMDHVEMRSIKGMVEHLQGLNINAAVVIVLGDPKDAIRILEIKET